MIRWKSGEQDELKKLIDRYNAKIYRSAKAGYTTPKTISKKGLTFSDRKQLERFKGDINRYLKIKPSLNVTTKEGVTLPKWYYEQLKVDVQRINSARAKQYKDLGLKEINPWERGLMGRVQHLALKPKQMPGRVKKEYFKDYIKSVEKQKADSYTTWRNQIYAENYLTALSTAGLFSVEEISQIEEAIKKMGYNNFYKLCILYEPPNVDFVYSATKTSLRRYEIKQFWADYVKEFQVDITSGELAEDDEEGV